MERNFHELKQRQWEDGLLVSVGLDSDYDRIPDPLKAMGLESTMTMALFNFGIVKATSLPTSNVGFYKPNIAFYEEHGADGLRTLKTTIEFINSIAPKVPVILDIKRADIGNTNKGYVRLAFEYLKADAVTVNPYFGRDALLPFLKYKEKGIFVLCKTSNDGSDEFQNMQVMLEDEKFKEEVRYLAKVDASYEYRQGRGMSTELYNHVAYRVVSNWNEHGNCGLVVGATYPKELENVRKIAPDLPILIPGIGAQGGDLEKTLRAGKDSKGQGMIVNSSSGIIFAGNDITLFKKSRTATLELHRSCRTILDEIKRSELTA
jgi:orotidine-5'-phosphate decarboxylase